MKWLEMDFLQIFIPIISFSMFLVKGTSHLLHLIF
uniref:Uncharacterized protein n=1 Tax=Rhizophora mucronata TaxID=61149 RepID=A0A2P2IRR7_RHIMU